MIRQLYARIRRIEQRMPSKAHAGGTMEDFCRAVWQKDPEAYERMAQEPSEWTLRAWLPYIQRQEQRYPRLGTGGRMLKQKIARRLERFEARIGGSRQLLTRTAHPLHGCGQAGCPHAAAENEVSERLTHFDPSTGEQIAEPVAQNSYRY